MAEQDKDLPLVVAEILIEMHELNGRMDRVESAVSQMAGTIQQMSGAIHRLAEVISHQQEASNRNFQLLMAADERNAARLEGAILSLNLRFDSLEHRLERLENK